MKSDTLEILFNSLYHPLPQLTHISVLDIHTEITKRRVPIFIRVAWVDKIWYGVIGGVMATLFCNKYTNLLSWSRLFKRCWFKMHCIDMEKERVLRFEIIIGIQMIFRENFRILMTFFCGTKIYTICFNIMSREPRATN